MKLRIFIIMLIFLAGINLVAQPPETTLQGTLIATGFRQSIPLDSDGPYPIGFNFTFYGNSYTEFYVSANGLVMFTDPDDVYNTSVSIPDASTPNNYIAPFWDNLSINASVDGGNIIYRTVGASPTRKCIIQYTNMGFDPNPTPFGTFAVILYETSNIIQIQFRLIVDPFSARSHGSNATIGLENSDGSSGVLYSYHNGNAVYTEDAISFTPSGSTYTINPDAFYDGVFLTTNSTLPEPGIVDLISPSNNAVVGTSLTFNWSPATNAASYILFIDTRSDLSTATIYDAGSENSYDISGLILDRTYYWSVFAMNATGMTWCEVQRFSTSTAPPLTPVPMTIWVEQGQDRAVALQYTGGDASPKAAVITSLPAQGQLYQYVSGSRGTPINSYPATVTDAGMNVIYSASGNSGNNAGNFNFLINDASGNSPQGLITVNVSPPGVPEVLLASKSTDYVEIQFNRLMSDPADKQDQFTVNVNDFPVTISSAYLKPGDSYTIILDLAIPLDGSEQVNISYNQGDVTATTGGYLFSFIGEPANLLAQNITFTQDLNKKFSDSPFVLTSSASSGLAMTYSSSNLTVATISSNVATFHSLGSAEISARQDGNSTFAPAKYIRTLTVARGDQIITFNPLTSRTVDDPDFSPGATASSGLPVSYTSSNPAVATIINNLVHIVGIGTSVITASQAGNTYYNPATSVPQTLTVTGSIPDTKTLNLTGVLLEGLYISGGTMRQAWNESGPLWEPGIADHVTISLHSSTNYANIIYSNTDVPLGTTGSTTVSIPSDYSDSYYITIKHRNSIEITTSVAISFENTTINLSFQNPANVYGYNLGYSNDSYYVIFGGDVNQNGIVESLDMTPIDNLSSSFGYGFDEDVNSDGLIDSRDMTIVDNNNSRFVSSVLP